MLAAVMVTLFWMLRSIRRAPLVFGIVVTAAALVLVSPNNPWNRRTEAATAYGVDASAQGRIDAWRTGMNMFKERPFSGVGAGAFMIAWPDFAPGDAGEVRTQHNTFIQLVSELGLPAILLFVTALGAAALGLKRAARARTSLSPLARGVQCGLVGFVLCSIFGGIAWTWPVYLLIGLGVATKNIAIAQGIPARVDDTVVSPMPEPVAALAGQ
jgi:putative inorganic carbon (HCO3(-)) transporter